MCQSQQHKLPYLFDYWILQLFLLLLFLFDTSIRTTTAAATATSIVAMASPHPTTTSRVVVVTGGNRGIGRALCEHLLEKYTDIQVIMGSRSKANGMSAVEEICQQMGDTCNGRLDVVELDTSSDDSVQAAATEIAKKYSKLYGIVNNAGMYIAKETFMFKTLLVQ